MPITIACPNCDARLEAADDIEGKKVQCKKCGEKFRARPVYEDEDDDRPARRAAKAAGKSRPRPAADDEDEDERPSRRTGKASRRREEDDEDDRAEDADRPRRRSRDEDDEKDEPRPRKTKGKKKKKMAVSPVVVLILSGVGLLIVIAVIGAIISLSGDKSDVSAPTGGPVTDAAAAGAGGGASAGDPGLPGWLEFADPNGQFKVRMPRMPAAPTKQQWPLSNGEQAEVTTYTVEIGGTLWAVAHMVVPGREPGAPADPVLDDAIGGGMGWTKGAVIKTRTNITHQGFPGRQAVLDYPGVKGSHVVRVILAGNRMFWLMARGDNFAAETPKVRGFLESLKIN